KQYEVGISKQKVEGNHTRQYAQLRDYCLELKSSNPNTTIKIEVERPEDINSLERKFKMVYVCLSPLKDGFKARKRDFLGLDGCFLSVDSENKDSWEWFLDCIGDDLDLFRNSNFTFRSDRQKGVIPAIADIFYSAAHRFCLKHIYDNMKLSWEGQMYRRCYEDMQQPLLKGCDVLLNNMCEVLNKQLVDAKDKPIITCLEFTREYLMKRIVNVQKVISKSDGPLTPNAAKLFKTIVKDAGQIKEWLEENKFSRAGKSISCIKCKGIGHNQRRCTNDPYASDPQVTQTQQSSQAPTATQALQTAPTTSAQTTHTAPSTTMNRPFHHAQLHASPTKVIKATVVRRMNLVFATFGTLFMVVPRLVPGPMCQTT
ncbi:mutator type transposase, partial [Tanacetum coccineum]